MSRSFESGLHVTWKVGSKGVTIVWPKVAPARLIPQADVSSTSEESPCVRESRYGSKDPLGCQAECDADESCQAWVMHWSHVREQAGDPAWWCCLKTGWTDIVPEPGTNKTSGIKEAPHLAIII